MIDKSLLSKALTQNAQWPDKEELLDVVYWSRQIMAILIGTVWGLFPLQGIFAILLYVAVTTLTMNIYVSSYQNQDIEKYGGFFEVAKEGFISAFASFLVVWIIMYSSTHAS